MTKSGDLYDKVLNAKNDAAQKKAQAALNKAKAKAMAQVAKAVK